MLRMRTCVRGCALHVRRACDGYLRVQARGTHIRRECVYRKYPIHVRALWQRRSRVVAATVLISSFMNDLHALTWSNQPMTPLSVGPQELQRIFAHFEIFDRDYVFRDGCNVEYRSACHFFDAGGTSTLQA